MMTHKKLTSLNPLSGISCAQIHAFCDSRNFGEFKLFLPEGF